MHIPKLDCDEGVYELGGHVGEEALNLKLWPKLRLEKKIFLASFLNRLLKNVLVTFAFPYALLLHHDGEK